MNDNSDWLDEWYEQVTAWAHNQPPDARDTILDMIEESRERMRQNAAYFDRLASGYYDFAEVITYGPVAEKTIECWQCGTQMVNDITANDLGPGCARCLHCHGYPMRIVQTIDVLGLRVYTVDSARMPFILKRWEEAKWN
jgi:hypothetical protein